MSAFDINAQTNVLRHKRERREFYKRHSLFLLYKHLEKLKVQYYFIYTALL